MKLEDLMVSLNITEYSQFLNDIFDQAMKEYEAEGDRIVCIDYLTQLNSEYKLFTNSWNDVLTAASGLKKCPNLLRFIYLLKHVFNDKRRMRKIIADFSIHNYGKSQTAFDFAPLFAMLPFVPKMVQDMKKRHVPNDIISDSLAGFESILQSFYERNLRYGIGAYMYWLARLINSQIIRINRFDFEMLDSFGAAVTAFKSKNGEYKLLMDDAVMHRDGYILNTKGYEDSQDSFDATITETNECFEGFPIEKNGLVTREKVILAKDEWEVVLTKDDKVLSVHIPANKSLASEVCEGSYDRARVIFQNCYPEFEYKAFCCNSWMMDPQLKTLLGYETNIIRFQNKYLLYPNESQGTGVFNFVFLKPPATRIENPAQIKELPEDTSLRRAIKGYYLKGKYIYEHGGVFF